MIEVQEHNWTEEFSLATHTYTNTSRVTLCTEGVGRGGRWYYGICLFDTSGLISNTVSVGVVSCYLIAVFRRSFLSKTVWRRTCSRHHHTENTCSLIFSFLWKKMPLFVFLFFLIKKRKEKHLSFIFHVLLPHWTPPPHPPLPPHTHTPPVQQRSPAVSSLPWLSEDSSDVRS